MIVILDKLRFNRLKNRYDSTSVSSRQTRINHVNSNLDNVYVLKKSLLTNTEKKYFECFKTILPDCYIIQPQINLATVIDKISPSRYQSELFRNIDFGVFDLNYKPLLMIEINDSTHNTFKRADRDVKVADICSKAGLPLISFWTNNGIDREYFIKRFSQYLDFSVSKKSSPEGGSAGGDFPPAPSGG